MPSNWDTVSLAEVCRDVRYGYTASAKTSPTPVKFLRVTDIAKQTLNWDEVPYCNISDKDLQRYRLEPGDIVIARMGTIGVSSIVKDPPLAVAASYLIRHRAEPSRVNAPFLAYVLRSPAFLDFVWTHGGTGAVQPNINARTLGQFRFRLPPLHEQHRISAILGALDDKIELNRRMSETLEGIARELYRAWFVDFTAGPASSQQSAGELPADWFYGTLADVSELSSESWQAKSAPDTVDYLDLSNVKWGRVLGTVKYPWDEAPSRARRILRTGDTIVGTVRPGNGSYSLINHEGLTGSTGFAVLRPKAATSRAITYMAATDPSNIERLAHLADGAAYPAVRPPVIHESPMIVPDQGTLLKFSSVVDPMLDRIAVCESENRTLEALRDTLLPKLISGELRVPEAEQLVSEVAY